MTSTYKRTAWTSFLPFAIGGFMLLPYAAWISLWAFAFPGSKNGFDEPLGVILIAVSIPLAAWFFVRALADITASMLNSERGPALLLWLPQRIIAVLPAATLATAAAGALFLALDGYAWYLVLLTAVTGIGIAATIYFGNGGGKLLLEFVGANTGSPAVSKAGVDPEISDAEGAFTALRLIAYTASIGAGLLLIALVTDPLLVLHIVALWLTAIAFALIVFLLPRGL